MAVDDNDRRYPQSHLSFVHLAGESSSSTLFSIHSPFSFSIVLYANCELTVLTHKTQNTNQNHKRHPISCHSHANVYSQTHHPPSTSPAPYPRKYPPSRTTSPPPRRPQLSPTLPQRPRFVPLHFSPFQSSQPHLIFIFHLL